MAFWLLLKRMPWQAWALVFVLIALWGVHRHGYNAGRDDYKAKVQAATQKAEQAARKAEQVQRDAFSALAAKVEKDKADAEANQAAVVADLRAGNLKLRREWRGCLSGSPGSAQGSDGEAGVRETGAASLVRVGNDADNQVTGLQEALRICQGR